MDPHPREDEPTEVFDPSSLIDIDAKLRLDTDARVSPLPRKLDSICTTLWTALS